MRISDWSSDVCSSDLYVYGEAKAGRDAGELCGLPPIGVKATRNVDEILALKADCVVYMPQSIDVDQLCRLLESGSNVVTTRTEFHHPASLDPALRERIEAACQRDGTSIHSTGSSPGFITEAVPLTLLSIQRRLDALHISEYADCSTRDSPEMLFRSMRFGTPQTQTASAGRGHHRAESFEPTPRVVAQPIA